MMHVMNQVVEEVLLHDEGGYTTDCCAWPSVLACVRACACVPACCCVRIKMVRTFFKVSLHALYRNHTSRTKAEFDDCEGDSRYSPSPARYPSPSH